MKNVLLIAISLISATAFSSQALAQKTSNFRDNINLAHEAKQGAYASNEPIQFKKSWADELLPGSALINKYASILKTEAEALTNTSLYSLIDDWFGTRYRYGGTTKKGIDCSSLTGRLMKEVYNVILPRTARQQYAACQKISPKKLTEGDLVFFNTRGGVSHVGFFLNNGYFVHASSSSGVTISHMDDAYYKNRFIGAGRINQSVDYIRMFL